MLTTHGFIEQPASRPTVALMLVTLDGRDPLREWKPWKTEFQRVIADSNLVVPIVPQEHQGDDIFKFRVDAADEDSLAKPERDWTDYVGAIVDPSKANVIERHRTYLRSLAKSENARFKRVGYYLFALVEGPKPAKTEADTIGTLILQVRDRLHVDPIFNRVTQRILLPVLLQDAGLMALSRFVRSQS